MDEVDCVVIGAGVIGLAVARSLALAGREVLVLESADGIGTGISSRNSEVIHAGIYYARDSLMARSCVAGRQRLYAYCRDRAVPHAHCGKLIVAVSESEIAQLDQIRARAAATGVDDLLFLSASQAQALEPELACAAALLSPSTGILDSHAYLLALQADAESAGAIFAFRSAFRRGAVERGRIAIEAGDAETIRLQCRKLVNCAGLQATAVAHTIAGMPAASIPRTYYAKGNYFMLTVRSPFSRLIYPVPVPGGLGTHLTLDLAGRARLGPDVEWVETLSYSVDPARANAFYAAARRYWPGLQDGTLEPGYSGIRPKMSPAGSPQQDFIVQTSRTHGVSGLINLFGIESPGLTASLALADYVRDCALAD